MSIEKKLIEGRFPCREVGAETQRERGASSSLPPLYFLHVWWARRPLTPSRAAVLGSILPADTNPEKFLRELGIVKKQAIIGDQRFTLVGNNLKLIENRNGKEIIPYSTAFQKALDKENERRRAIREKLMKLINNDDSLATNPVVLNWLKENEPIGTGEMMSLFAVQEYFVVETVIASPATINERLSIKESFSAKEILGSDFSIDPEDMYAYSRAYETPIKPIYNNITVFDPTAGGGSIPFEAMRLGCNVISNDLNPVATAIEKATLTYPVVYGSSLLDDLSYYGKLLTDQQSNKLSTFYPEQKDEQICDYLYCRTVICPHCGERAPLLNAFALQKKSDGWMVIPQTEGTTGNKHIRFIPVRLKNGKGPNGEDPEKGTVKLGTGSCLFCGQAIESSEIKKQACGKSSYGKWKDELYCVVANHNITVINKNGQSRQKSELFFREPTDEDRAALARAEEELKKGWSHWESLDLIPTEKLPKGLNTAQQEAYGVDYWYKMFTSRQLLGHLIAMETLNKMIPGILNEHGQEKGTAIITYLQYMIDKCIDYNSRQTRWHYTRGAMVGSFGRHDFSLKWSFGEMIYTGNNSGLIWGKNQILDAYKGICGLLNHKGIKPATVINGSAANTDLPDKSVDVICWDPPYYDNVQYAELSDYFYVWQKRTFRNLYPGVFSRLMTNKEDEAVANSIRAGSDKEAENSYEQFMGEIFKEIRRVTKDDGIMTMMFTHRSQDAWETLTRALIVNGWVITSTFPVDSEAASSLHQKDKAAAASSIFITCRKRDIDHEEVSTWQGFGNTGVIHQVREAVREGLKSYEGLHLNAVDEMVASYGCALKVLSENWPVCDGEDMVSPAKAMREASTVVAQYQMERLTGGLISATDLEAETSIVMTMLGIYGIGILPYDDALTLSRSLNIRLDNVGAHGYKVDGHVLGIGTGKKGETSYAPVVLNGSKLRILLPEERNQKRLENPQTEWDILQGVIMAFRDGDIPVARAYLHNHTAGNEAKIIALLRVWGDNCGSNELKKETDRILYGLK